MIGTQRGPGEARPRSREETPKFQMSGIPWGDSGHVTEWRGRMGFAPARLIQRVDCALGRPGGKVPFLHSQGPLSIEGQVYHPDVPLVVTNLFQVPAFV